MRQVIGDFLPVALGVAIWLTADNATVMSVMLLVIGVAIFGKSVPGLQECR